MPGTGAKFEAGAQHEPGGPADTAASAGEGALGGFRLHRWSDPAVVSVAAVALAAGFGQFGVVAALGHVATTFGQIHRGVSLADEAGLSGTTLGIGLAIIRLASLGGLPIASWADRLGRKRTLVAACASGLALTAAAAASPSFWWFVAIFAVGRPALSAVVALSIVMGSEQTASRDRAKAVALMAAAYAVGAGTTAVLNSLFGSALGFRGLMLLALVPLVALPAVNRLVTEPDRFTRQHQAAVAGRTEAPPMLGAVARPYLPRLVVISLLAFSVSIVTGPADSFIFLYAENVLHVAGTITALMVVGAGAMGLGGLLIGRFLADTIGRKPATALGMLAIIAASVVAYSGSSTMLVIGYVGAVTAGALFAPAAGALANELLPTEVRATMAGWQVAAGVLGAVCGLVTFGAVATVDNHFSDAAVITFLPVALTVLLLLTIPETRNREPESLWPDASHADPAGGVSPDLSTPT